ncbi:hypothetical protein [Tenacibaculum phage PTm5]|uniref:Uncharacterized protein n=2 Tax=Shirahamavirus PTm1 TaxID=2846435 RepID=A0A5S9BZB0_9CAUD|nr:hypothetical protein [Tenacibaculum phage PTm5]
MLCNKKSFDTADSANNRANEINNSNKHTTNKKLRPYKCDICSKYHLTSMNKYSYKYKKDKKYRNQVRENNFIRRETEYWNKKFGIIE